MSVSNKLYFLICLLLVRVKLIIEGVESEEAVLLEDLYSMDRKFAEHYNVSEKECLIAIFALPMCIFH